MRWYSVNAIIQNFETFLRNGQADNPVRLKRMNIKDINLYSLRAQFGRKPGKN